MVEPDCYYNQVLICSSCENSLDSILGNALSVVGSSIGIALDEAYLTDIVLC